ncbi:hypothetical protein EDD18DRAFT_1119670 [Armillaria luteobubalina]|uniref:Uncharacterized protein n=1 Tax=Armillaria luteobubalina TaxID=153913 RepID=A0AA39U5R9_9AGAR|nr:hypothetical protein EDD18DRAFT_1119670 [Armillaria luteobubalina]
MLTESCPVPLRRLLGHSQTAQCQKEVHPLPVAENADHPTAPEQHPSPTTNTELCIHSANPVPSLPTTSPLYRLTAAGVYPLPSHMTATSSSTLPQLYMQPAPAVARLLSHGFNPNVPWRASTVQHDGFRWIQHYGCKKASILRMTLGDRQAPVCHILIYPFVSPHHYYRRKTQLPPHTERIHAAPVDTYNLEQMDIEPLGTHAKTWFMYHVCPTSNDTYKDIHAQLLAHNVDGTNPQIPGLKTDNLDHLTFDNMGWCFLQLLTHKPDNALLTFNKNVKQTQFNLSYMIQRKYLATPGQFTIVIEHALNHHSKKHLALSRSPSPHALLYRPIAYNASGTAALPSSCPYYMGLVWPAPDRAELLLQALSLILCPNGRSYGHNGGQHNDS